MATQNEHEPQGIETSRPDSQVLRERTNRENRDMVLAAFARQFEAFREAPEAELEDWEAAERGVMAEMLDTGKIDLASGKDSFRENGHTERLPVQAFMNYVAFRADGDEQFEDDRRILEKHSRSPISTIRGNGSVSSESHRRLVEEAVELTTDRRSAVRRVQTGVRWFYPPNNIGRNGLRPQIPEAQSMDEAVRGYEDALAKYQRAQDPIDKKISKRELDLTIKQLEALTGEQSAVKEFVAARREGDRKSGKADRGTATKLELRTSKRRIERAADRLYELEDLKTNEPILLGESTPTRRTSATHEGSEQKDQSSTIRTQTAELLSDYQAAWQETEKLRIERDEANPTPRYFIPEIKAAVSNSTNHTTPEKSDDAEPAQTNPVKGYIPPAPYESIDWSKAQTERESWEAKLANLEASLTIPSADDATDLGTPTPPSPDSGAPTPSDTPTETLGSGDQARADEDADRARRTEIDDKRRAARTAIDDADRLGLPRPELDKDGFLIELSAAPTDGAGSPPDGGTPGTAEDDADDNLSLAEELLAARVKEIEESYAQTLFDLTDKDNDQARIDYLNKSLEEDRLMLIKLTGNEELFGKFEAKVQEFVNFINEKGQENLSPEDQQAFDRFDEESDVIADELTKAALEKHRQDSSRDLTPNEALDKAEDSISNLLRALMMAHLHKGDPGQVAKYEEEHEIYKQELIALTGDSETVDKYINAFNNFQFIGHKPGDPIPEEAQKAFDEMKAASNHLEDMAFSKAELAPVFRQYLETRSQLISPESTPELEDARNDQILIPKNLEELTGDKNAVTRYADAVTDLVARLRQINPNLTLRDFKDELKLAEEAGADATPAQTELIDSAKALTGFEMALVKLRVAKNSEENPADPAPEPIDPLDIGGSEDGGVPPLEPTPTSEKQSVKFNILFTSLDPAYDQEAEKWAEQRLQQDLAPSEGRLGKLRSMRRIVSTRITEEGKRQEYTRRFKKALIEAGNPYAEIKIHSGKVTQAETDRDKFETAIQSTLKGLDIAPEQFVARKAEVDKKLQEKISFELLEYIAGRLTPSEIEERFARFAKANSLDLRKHFGKEFDSSDFMAGFSSNIVQKVGEIREAIDYGAITLDQVDFNVGFAIPRWGTETQAELTRRDKLIKGAQRRKGTGVLANPLVLGGAASVGTSLAWGAAGLGMRTIAPVAGVLPGALIGGWNAKARRSYDLKRDRATLERDQASGIKTRSDQPRRLALDSFSRRKTSVDKLFAGTGNLISRDLSGNFAFSDEEIEQNKKALNALISRIAEIDVRRRFGISEQTDHVMYSSDRVFQQEKLALEELRLKAIDAVRFSGISHEEYQRILNERTQKWEEFLTRTNKEQDKKFDKYRTRESRKAFLEGAAKGAVGAGVVAVGTTGIRIASDTLGIDVVGGVRSWIDERVGEYRRELSELNPVTSTRTTESSLRFASKDLSAQTDVFNNPGPVDAATTPDVEAQVFAQEAPIRFHDAELNGKTISIPDHTRLVMDRANGGHDLIYAKDGTVLLNNVRWENGRLTADAGLWPADKIMSDSTTTPEMRKVMGKNGVWREMSADIRSIDWDANGTHAKYDKDELRFFNRRDGNAVVFNIPKSSNGIFLNINGDRVWLPETRDGVVRLDLDSKKLIPGRHDGMTYGDAARIAINQDELRKYHGSLQTEVHPKRREIFRVDTIEAGTLRNGNATIHATIQGCGETPRNIKMGETTHTVSKILAGEFPVDAGPTPTPTPSPTPSPEPTPTPTPEPTKTPLPTPTTRPENPIIGNGFTFELPDLSNFQFPPTIATPMARRYSLEAARPAVIMPNLPVSPTREAQATPSASTRQYERIFRNIGVRSEVGFEIIRKIKAGKTLDEIAAEVGVTKDVILEIRDRSGIKSIGQEGFRFN